MVLKHRDTEVLRFEWLEPQGVRIVSVNENAVRFLRMFVNRVRPALYSEWLGFQPELTKAQISRVRLLRGFRFRRHKRYNLPAERLEAIEDFTQKRISQIVEFGRKADDLLKITDSVCTVNSKREETDCTKEVRETDSLSIQIEQNLKADPFITKDELAEILQVSPRTVATRLRKLKEISRIRRVGPPKTGHWEVV